MSDTYLEELFIGEAKKALDSRNSLYEAGYEKGKSEGGGIDWSVCTDFAYFSSSNNRNHLVPQLKYEDTRNSTRFDCMFADCTELVEIPDIDTRKGINFAGMFTNCEALETAPRIDTSNGEIFQNMYDGCTSLTTIPELNLTNATNVRYMLRNCSALTHILFTGTIYTSSVSLSSLPNLTVESLVSFLNAFEDRTGLSSIKLTIGSTNIAKLSDDQLQIAYDKNLTLA